MPIIRANRQFQAIMAPQGKSIARVYHGTTLVWQSARSCYGSGVWRNDKPWLNNDTWKNKP